MRSSTARGAGAAAGAAVSASALWVNIGGSAEVGATQGRALGPTSKGRASLTLAHVRPPRAGPSVGAAWLDHPGEREADQAKVREVEHAAHEQMLALERPPASHRDEDRRRRRERDA